MKILSTKNQWKKEHDAAQARRRDVKKRADEISMRVQSARDGQQGTSAQIEQKRTQLVEMANQKGMIQAQMTQVKMEQDQYRAQLGDFKLFRVRTYFLKKFLNDT